LPDTIFWIAAGIVIPSAAGSLACVVLFLAKLRIPISGPVADIVLLLPATGSLESPLSARPRSCCARRRPQGGDPQPGTQPLYPLPIAHRRPLIDDLSIPAFFAAGKYGPGLIVAMALVFAISTIATYMLVCVYSTAGLQRVRLGTFERYGEVLSGAFIALVGVAFWIWPIA